MAKRKRRCLQNTYCAGSIPARASLLRRCAGAAERAGLENRYGGNVIGGSNPSISAMRIQPVVIAAIKKDNQFLLTKRVQIDPEDKDFAPFVWNLPGGAIEKNETADNALIREVKEELGIDILKYKLLPKTFIDTRHGWQGIFTVFLCQLKDSNQKIILNHEAEEYGWFTKEEASKLKVLPHTIEMIKEVNKINLT